MFFHVDVEIGLEDLGAGAPPAEKGCSGDRVGRGLLEYRLGACHYS